MRKHPGLIGSKKRKLLPLKNNNNYDKNKIFRINLRIIREVGRRNLAIRATKKLISIIVLLLLCLMKLAYALITRLASPLLIHERE